MIDEILFNVLSIQLEYLLALIILNTLKQNESTLPLCQRTAKEVMPPGN